MKKNGITLADYYDNIPKYPRSDFLTEVCKRCEIKRATVYAWLTGKAKPQKSSHYLILSEITGIAPEKLFES